MTGGRDSEAENAARYLWLRDDTDGDTEYGVFRCAGMLYPTGEAMLWGHDLDAAIDAERQAAAAREKTCRFCGWRGIPETAADPYTTDGTVEVCGQCNNAESCE